MGLLGRIVRGARAVLERLEPSFGLLALAVVGVVATGIREPGRTTGDAPRGACLASDHSGNSGSVRKGSYAKEVGLCNVLYEQRLRGRAGSPQGARRGPKAAGDQQGSATGEDQGSKRERPETRQGVESL